MASASTKIVMRNKEVAFAILAGEGKPFQKKMMYNLAVEITEDEKNEIVDKLETFWNDNKSSKAKKPGHPNDRLVQESEHNKGMYTLWSSQEVSKKIVRKVAKGTGYGMKHFLEMGNGSNIDFEINVYHYNNSDGEGLGFRLAGVTLNKFVAYTAASELDGDELADEDIVVDSGDDKDSHIADFRDALEDGDFDEAEDILDDELEDHPQVKELRKELRTARK